ncbi:MAG: NAD(P)H-dependent oxidoreductase subunit E [Lutisporaceae bacterium]
MEEKASITSIIQNIGSTQDKLIEILIAVQAQSKEHYISEEQLNMIARFLDIPLSKVYGVASFYSMLSTKKKGKYVIEICNSGPCYVKNSSQILKGLEELLNIKVGEMTPDGLFSIEYTSCFGACNIAPAIKINDEIYGNLTNEKVAKIVESLSKEVI